MSPGRRPSAAEPRRHDRQDQRALVLDPAERKAALLGVIGAREAAPGAVAVPLRRFLGPRCAGRGARTRLRSRSDPHQARQGRQEAAEEAVGRARGNGRRRARATPIRSSKYHAKYLVADDTTAIITTLNPTRKCFTRTWDAVLITQDPAVVKGLLTLFGRRRRRAAAVAPADQPAADRRPGAIARARFAR